MLNQRNTEGRQQASRRYGFGLRLLLGAIVPVLFMTTACDSLDRLLEVDYPGNVSDGDLDDPRLAVTLMVSAQENFECAFDRYIYWTNLWVPDGEIHDASGGRPGALFSTRSISMQFYADHCVGTVPHFAPLQTARMAAERASRLISNYPAEALATNKDFLIAKSDMYAGFSYVLMGEQFCELAFDGGPAVSREDTWRLAESRFASALAHAGSVTSGPRAAEARDIEDAARIGRARARLNLGNLAGVVSDASLVRENFVLHATYDANPVRRRNNIYEANVLGNGSTAGITYRELTIAPDGRATQADGVPDPRVPVVHEGRVNPASGTAHWEQRKYNSRNARIPIATWREAQLMIAEAEGGATAVAIINRLRDTFGLPHFNGSDPIEIRDAVREERRREMFLQGSRLGDKLRWNEPWIPDHPHFEGAPRDFRGRATEDNTCMPLPDFELLGNPNFLGR